MRGSRRIGSGACLDYTKAYADRIAASSELGILVASCGFKASAPELYVREQLTFRVCSMWYLFLQGEGFQMELVSQHYLSLKTG